MALTLVNAEGAVSKGRLAAVLALIILFSEIATFEILMVYPALPHMAPVFQTLSITWVAAIVTLTGAATLPLSGKAADKYGKKRIILILGMVFVLGSIICAMSDSFAVLLAGRALQGTLVGIVSLSYGLVRDIIPRDFVPVALGAVVTGVGMSAVAGPFIAGWLIDGFGYAAIFWFMAIYIAVLIPVYAAVVPESSVRIDTPVDYLGVALLGPSVGMILLAISKAKSWGWTSGLTMSVAAIGVLMLVAFIIWQFRAPNPLIDMKIILGAKFGATVIAVACVTYMMNAHAILIPTMLQTPAMPGISYGAGLSATTLALWCCPLGIVSMFTGPLGGFLSKYIGARYVLLTAAVLFEVVMFLGSRMFTVEWKIGIMSAIGGIAAGFTHSSNANLIQDALPPKQGGVGNGIAGVGALLAAAIATTMTGVVMSNHVLMVIPESHAVIYADSAFTSAYFYAALVGVVGIVVAALMKHGRAAAVGGMQEGSEDLAELEKVAVPSN